MAGAIARLRFTGAAGEVAFNSERAVVQPAEFYSVSGNKLVKLIDGDYPGIAAAQKFTQRTDR